MSREDTTERRRASGYIGWAVSCLLLVGLVSLAAGLFVGWNEEYNAAGLCFIASALSFGMLLNGLLRR